MATPFPDDILVFESVQIWSQRAAVVSRCATNRLNNEQLSNGYSCTVPQPLTNLTGTKWKQNLSLPKLIKTREPTKLVEPYTDKKKIKFSSYIRIFGMKQLQSLIWLTASSYMGKYLRISSYIRKPFLIYTCIWLCNCSTLNFLINEENFLFFSISVPGFLWPFILWPL